MSTPHRERLLQEVTARAATDLVFRKSLLTSPEAAIRDTFGVVIPSDVRIRFMEKPAGVDVLIVLPSIQPPVDELDDDDLDAVAGGTGTEDTNECW